MRPALVQSGEAEKSEPRPGAIGPAPIRPGHVRSGSVARRWDLHLPDGHRLQGGRRAADHPGTVKTGRRPTGPIWCGRAPGPSGPPSGRSAAGGGPVRRRRPGRARGPEPDPRCSV